jgi:hypothetical protein
MVQHDRITRIEVWHYNPPGVSTPPDRSIMTEKRIGVWSTEADVISAYGKNLVIQPHPYDNDNGHYLVLDAPDHKRGIIFETLDGKVTSFRSGLYPALAYMEGCA